MTNDLQRRMMEHREGSVFFTSRYGVRHLLYYEEYQDVRYAIAREKEIKGWRREKKVKLIESVNPYWRFLNEEEDV